MSGYLGVMDDTNGASSAPPRTPLPERRITVNMLVGYNMARWRQAMGWTGERLGEELGGWTKGAVSAAERSWDGRKVRQFSADLIGELASIFRIPVAGMLLPPDDDGRTRRYVIDDGAVPMGMYFRLLMSGAEYEPDTPAAVAYQKAWISAVARYADSDAAEAVAGAVAGQAAEEQIKQLLADAQETRGQLAGLYSLVDKLLAQNAALMSVLERALADRRPES